MSIGSRAARGPVVRTGGPAEYRSRPNRGTRTAGKADGKPVMVVRFSQYGTWYPIDDGYGEFLERTMPGAFRNTIANDGAPKVLFNHGNDATIGRQILGVPSLIEDRADGPYMEVPLFPGMPDLIVSGLRAGAYGSSFMFEVVRDSWVEIPKPSAHNPDGIPERTIHEVRLFEAGPVTWPANPDATAGLRAVARPSSTSTGGIGRAERQRRIDALRARIADWERESEVEAV